MVLVLKVLFICNFELLFIVSGLNLFDVNYMVFLYVFISTVGDELIRIEKFQSWKYDFVTCL